jgi:hypothetical protein
MGTVLVVPAWLMFKHLSWTISSNTAFTARHRKTQLKMPLNLSNVRVFERSEFAELLDEKVF